MSGLTDDGVTDERPVRACRYVPKALYSGGESYDIQLPPGETESGRLTAEACSSAILRSIGVAGMVEVHD